MNHQKQFPATLLPFDFVLLTRVVDSMLAFAFYPLSAPLLVLASTPLVLPSDGFVMKPARTKVSSFRQMSNNEKDLFDFFDPLLSPHSYPNGVQPGAASEVAPGIVESNYRDPLRLNLG